MREFEKSLPSKTYICICSVIQMQRFCRTIATACEKLSRLEGIYGRIARPCHPLSCAGAKQWPNTTPRLRELRITTSRPRRRSFTGNLLLNTNVHHACNQEFCSDRSSIHHSNAHQSKVTSRTWAALPIGSPNRAGNEYRGLRLKNILT